MKINDNKLVVVLGMHRSGTSAVTRGLQVMGVNLGNELLPPQEDNITGFWEDVDLNALNIQMLSSLNQDWHFLTPIQSTDMDLLWQSGYFTRALELLQEKMSSAEIFGFKDPRVAKLLPFWKEVFSKLQLKVSYVITIRHPLSVCKSLEKRHGFDFEKSSLLWLEHVINSLACTEGENRVIVNYDHLIQSPDTEMKRVAKEIQLQIDFTELEKYKNEFLREELRHTVYQVDDLRYENSIPPLVQDVYCELLKIVEGVALLTDASVQTKIAQWANEFSRLKSTLIFIDRLDSTIRTITEENAKQRSEFNEKIVAKNAELNAKNAELNAKNAELNAKNVELDAKNAELNTKNSELSAIYQSKAWRLVIMMRRMRLLLLPPGSYSENLIRLLYRSLKTWRDNGLTALLHQVRNRTLLLDLNTSLSILNYQDWISNNEPGEKELAEQRETTRSLSYRPLISILTPVYNTPEHVLHSTIQSVIDQTYDHWELCLVDGNSNAQTKAVLEHFQKVDARIRCKFLTENLGVAGNTNVALQFSTGEYINLLDHDDLLPPWALFEAASYINQNPDVEIIYGDEDRIDMNGNRHSPFFKPDWSPELLLSFMYIGHSTYKKELVESVGGFRSEYDFSQDYDLALRATEMVRNVGHIAKVLYHWRELPGSAAAGDKDYARISNIAALADALKRRGYAAEAVALPTHNQVVYRLNHKPFVSIIIPSDNPKNITKSIEAIRKKTNYPNYEILVVTNSRVIPKLQRKYKEKHIRFASFDQPYNFSAKCNLGVSQANGEFLLFLNDDVYPITNEWVEKMLGSLQDKAVGAVSPKLVYTNGTIQHAGLVTGVRNLVGTAFHTFPKDSTQYFNMAQSPRTVSALSAACLLMRRSVFMEIGGYDELNTPIMHSDLDLCFKIRDKGLRLVYMPEAELTHVGHLSIKEIESKPIMNSSKADAYLLKRWAKYVAYDPYFPGNMRDMLYIDSPTKYRMWATNSPESVSRHPNIFMQTHDLSLSGVPIIAHDQAIDLAMKEYFVMVGAAESGELLQTYRNEQIPIIVDPLILSSPQAIEKLLTNFDVVVANTIMAWRLVLTAKSLRIPVLWIIQEGDFGVEMAQSNPDIQKALSLADWVVFSSHQTLFKYSKFCKADNCVSMFFGVEAPPHLTQSPIQNENEKLQIVHIGSIENRKGQDILINAIKILNQEIRDRIEVSFIGRILDKEFYQRQLQESTGLSNIHWLGSLSQVEVWELLAKSDILVCSSRDETGPLVVYEAMSLGKVVLSTPVGAVPEIIQHGVNGMIYSRENPIELSGLLTKLYSDKTLMEKLGVEALATYNTMLTKQLSNEKIAELIKSMIK